MSGARAVRDVRSAGEEGTGWELVGGVKRNRNTMPAINL